MLGCDFSEAMLDRARTKAAARDGGARVRFEWADAMALPYDDDTFDAATVGFGARNFEDLARGLREMARVVRPGGRVVVLEITTPTRAPLSQFYGLWFDRVVPVLGEGAAGVERLAARIRGGEEAGAGSIADAYTYLPNSVKRFPGPPSWPASWPLRACLEVSYLLTAGGIVAIHSGTVGGGADSMTGRS